MANFYSTRLFNADIADYYDNVPENQIYCGMFRGEFHCGDVISYDLDKELSKEGYKVSKIINYSCSKMKIFSFF